MTRTFTMIALAASASLAACDNSDHTIVSDPAGPDPMANAVANAGTVTLPPSIAASNVYRCKDNSLVYIDWLSDGTARLKKERNEVGTTLAKAEDGSLIAEGQKVTGAAADPTITVNGQSCKR